MFNIFAAVRMTSQGAASTRPCEIFIQRRHGKPASKSAKTTWHHNVNSQITEACVKDLGFPLTEDSGRRKRSLILKFSLKGFPATRREEFLIIAQGEHEIFLGSDACDWLQKVMVPGSYPVFTGTGK